MPGRTYSEEEVREILRRAVEKSPGAGPGLTRDDLLSTARDAGIDLAAVEEAISSIEWEREVGEEIATLRSAERRKLTSSFLTWAIVSAGLGAIHWFSGGSLWFVWLIGVWAVVLLLRLKGAFFPNPDAERRRAERNLTQRRRQRSREGRGVAGAHRREAARASGPTAAPHEPRTPAARVRAPDADALGHSEESSSERADGAARKAERGGRQP